MQKRLEKELQEITTNAPTGVIVEQNDKDRLKYFSPIIVLVGSQSSLDLATHLIKEVASV